MYPNGHTSKLETPLEHLAELPFDYFDYLVRGRYSIVYSSDFF
jgi:hypothetical protein